MAKVTSKLQLTVPKALAEQFGIRPGDQIDFTPAGEVIRMTRRGREQETGSIPDRLQLFDQATERQRRRQRLPPIRRAPADRGWRREDLYQRGRAR
jgi:AbrB family looped-hinge helix DNA binding protein